MYEALLRLPFIDVKGFIFICFGLHDFFRVLTIVYELGLFCLPTVYIRL